MSAGSTGMITLFKNRKKKKANEEMSLQITSMADIFTIILVFLLKTTASGLNTVAPNGAALPVAKGKEIIQDTLKMEVNRDVVTVDDKIVLNLQNFELPVTEIASGGMSQAVYQAFMNKRRSNQESNANSTLLVLADENTPYSSLKPVLAAAANAGFVDLQLVVVENN